MRRTADPIQLSRIEKKLGRKLTEDERSGFVSIRIRENGERKRIRIDQVNLISLNIFNTALTKEEK